MGLGICLCTNVCLLTGPGLWDCKKKKIDVLNKQKNCEVWGLSPGLNARRQVPYYGVPSPAPNLETRLSEVKKFKPLRRLTRRGTKSWARFASAGKSASRKARQLLETPQAFLLFSYTAFPSPFLLSVPHLLEVCLQYVGTVTTDA